MGARTLVIFGAGGFAKEVWHVVNKTGDWQGVEFVGAEGEQAILDRTKPVKSVIGIGQPSIIRKIHQKMSKSDFVEWVDVVHPNADYGQGVHFGGGNIVCSHVSMTCDIEIGRCNIFNLGCTVGHDCVIEDYCVVCPGAHLSGNVTLEDEVYVGTGAVILEGVTVGAGAVIGAGAVVTEDVPAGVTVVGIPAKALDKSEDKKLDKPTRNSRAKSK